MKIKQLLLAAAAMVFAVACNEVPDEPVKPTPEVQIGVMPMEVSYVAAAGEQTVSVVAKGAWTATADAEWIKVEPASGEAGTVSVKISAEKNETTEAREGKVVFAVGEEKAEVAVAQQAGEPAGSEVWGIAGSHQGDTEETQWKPANAPEMGFADGYYYQKGMELKAGHEFKFVKDKAWDVNRGYSGSKPMTANYFYAVEHNGQNIKILADGTYDVYLNEEATVFYLMEAGKLPAEAKDSSELEEAEVPEDAKGWRVVGTHNGWNKDGEDVNMTLSNGLWAATGVTLDKTDANSGLVEFKFVQNRDWSKTVGVDNDAELAVNCFYAAGGSNIKVAAGTYDLYLSENASKFYVMEAGVAPSEAKDGAAGGETPEASVVVTVSEEDCYESAIYFTVAAENIVAASWNIIATELVDETITAEYILSEEGGYAIAEEEFNDPEIAFGMRRGIVAGTEYTILVAYEDAAGNKALATATYTTPGGGAVTPEYYAINATKLGVFQEELYEESIITFYGEQYDLVVYLNTLNFVDKDLYFIVEEGEVGVTGAFVRDHNSMETVETAVGGEFSLFADPEYGYYVTAMFNGESGVSIEALYSGNIEGLGGGAVAAEIDFVVSTASVGRFADLPDDGSIWEVTLTSTDNDTLVLVFDTSMDDAPILIGAPYPIVAMHGTDYGIVQWASYGVVGGVQCLFAQSTEFLTVNTMYDGVSAETDKYTFDGILSAMTAMGQEVGVVKVSTPNPVSLYTQSLPATPVDYEWEYGVANVTAKALIDTEFGESEFHLINEEAGAQISIYVNTTDVVDKDFYLEGDAYGSDGWVTYACIRDLQGNEITKLAYVEFSVYASWMTPGAFYIGCYADTVEGGNVAVDYDGMVEGLEATGGEAAEKIFVVSAATIERSEEYPDDASVWYVELTSTTGDVIGLTFDQVVGDAPIFVGGVFETVGYINGETALIDQALSWNEFGGMWKASEGDALYIQMQPMAEDYSKVAYIFSGSLTAVDNVTGADTYYVTFQTDGQYVEVDYAF